MISGAGFRAAGAVYGLALAGLVCVVAPSVQAQELRSQELRSQHSRSQDSRVQSARPLESRPQDMALCNAPLEARGLEHAPVHFRERIAQGKPIKIVAIGSSS